MRTAAKILILVVAIGSVAWSSLFIYWHLKIRGAIRQLMVATATPKPGQSEADIFGRRPDCVRYLREEAGCRALPYLVGALDPKQSPEFLETLSMLITLELDKMGARRNGAPEPKDGIHRCRINLGESAEDRAKKILIAREYWHQHGHRHHQMWRIWTGSCVPADEIMPEPADRR